MPKTRPILCNESPAFQRAPHVDLLRLRKAKPFPLSHKHHLWDKIYIGWGCIDRLSPQCLPERLTRKLSYGNAQVFYFLSGLGSI